MPDTRRTSGFTLIELLIVMLVMGVMAGVAAPRYREALTHARVDAAARRVAADLRYARSEALRSSSTQTISFSASDESYDLPGIDDPDHPAQSYRVDLAAEPYGVDLASVDFGGGATVDCGVYGVLSSGGYVRLQSGDARVAVVCSSAGDISYESW